MWSQLKAPDLFSSHEECGCYFNIWPHDVTIAFWFPLFAADEGVFKAGAERSETRGAAEIQEDEDTQVEVPVDQVFRTLRLPWIRRSQFLQSPLQVLC